MEKEAACQERRKTSTESKKERVGSKTNRREGNWKVDKLIPLNIRVFYS
jgi:hypothetical protein